MKIIITSVFFFLSFLSFAQENSYPHCNCTESYSENGPYKLVSNGTEMETGELLNGKRNGLWTSKNKKGIIIRKANYTNGQLSGTYELFHFDGTTKLKAEFFTGLPIGNWAYYNSKGKVIKAGKYSEGKAVGTWKIYDGKGKQLYTEYNFDTSTETISPKGKQYFQKGGIVRDDQSGEWMVLYLPKRNIKVQTQPLGGYMLASDLFVDYFNLPAIFMNTYAQYEFNTTVKLHNNVAAINTIALLDKSEKFDITGHSLPFMVDTNSPNKLTRVVHKETSIEFLKNQIKEYVMLAGPWISNGADEEIVIRTPFVVNEVKRW